MELYTIFTTAFVVGLSGAMAPGPLLTVTIGESARRGFMAGPLISIGHAVLELFLIIAIVAGLSVVLTATIVSHTIAVLGGAFLIYMGAVMAKDALAGKITLAALQPGVKEAVARGEGKKVIAGKEMTRLVITGILTSISNPFWTLWWATIGLVYITMSMKSGCIGLASFYTGHILSDFTWYCLIAAAVAGGRRFLNDSIYRGIMAVCGVFLVGLGGYFLYYGLFT